MTFQGQVYSTGSSSYHRNINVVNMGELEHLEFQSSSYTTGNAFHKGQVECTGDCHVAHKPSAFFCVNKRSVMGSQHLHTWQQQQPHRSGWGYFQFRTPIAACQDDVCGRWECHYHYPEKGPNIDDVSIRCPEPSREEEAQWTKSKARSRAEGGAGKAQGQVFLRKRSSCNLVYHVTQFSDVDNAKKPTAAGSGDTSPSLMAGAPGRDRTQVTNRARLGRVFFTADGLSAFCMMWT